MGCVASVNTPKKTLDVKPTDAPSDESAVGSSDPAQSPNSAASSPVVFMGVVENQVLLVRDQFNSKYDGSLMYKWRKVDVLKVDGEDNSRILVHFQGWADTFDHWVDLHTEMDRVAPLLLLSKAQCSAGVALTEEELRTTRDYLLTGSFQAPPLEPKSSLKKTNSFKRTASGINSADGGASQIPLDFFAEGKLLDILDIFTPINSTQQKTKWRKARIINVEGRRIRISYIGWDSRFDETLDVIDNADRISPVGTKTTEQSARSLTALKEKKSPQFLGIPRSKLSFLAGKATSDNDEDAEDDDTTDSNDSSLANATTNTVNSGGIFSHIAKFMSSNALRQATASSSSEHRKNGRHNTNSEKASRNGNSGGGTSSGASVSSERSKGGSRRKKKHRHYSSYEEARDDVLQKSAEEMAEELEKERKFLEALGRKRLHVFEVEGDGNCLFRGISHQLYLTEDHHEVLRQKCVEHLMTYKSRFSLFCAEDFDEHVREMSQVGTWGDELEIRALEEILDRHIVIYSSESAKLDEPINTNIEEEKILNGVVPIMLSYHGLNHYNSIYDERYPLPLPLRGSNLLLQARTKLIDSPPQTQTQAPVHTLTRSNSNMSTNSKSSQVSSNATNIVSSPNYGGNGVYPPQSSPSQPHSAHQAQQQLQMQQQLQQQQQQQQQHMHMRAYMGPPQQPPPVSMQGLQSIYMSSGQPGMYPGYGMVSGQTMPVPPNAAVGYMNPQAMYAAPVNMNRYSGGTANRPVAVGYPPQSSARYGIGGNSMPQPHHQGGYY